MIVCGNCKGENRDGARFCRMCGATLTQESAIESSLEPPMDEGQRVIQPEDELPTPAEELSVSQIPKPPGMSMEENPVTHEAEIPMPLDVASEAPQLGGLLVGPGAAGEKGPPQVQYAESAETAGIADASAPPAPPAVYVQQDETSEPAPPELEQRLEEAQPVEMGEPYPEFLSNGRFRVLRLISDGPDTRAYEAEDALRCWVCQTVQSDPEPNFCEMCGAQLTEKPLVHLRAVQVGTPLPEGTESFEEGGVIYLVEPAQPLALQEKKALRVRLHVGYQSDAGHQRDLNEDSILSIQVNALCEMKNAPVMGFFAVADGLGGHDTGEVASRTAIHALAGYVLEKIFAPVTRRLDMPVEELSTALVATVQDANRAILSLREQSATDINMGCTLTAAIVKDTTAVIANVGDSRTYRMHNGVLSKVTNDHSIVARLLERGLIRPEEVYTHEQKGVIYRSLGDKPALDVDIFQLELELGDRLVLCCDGLWEMVRDPYIEDVLLELYDPQQACDRLVQQANLAGGEDNISVIIINVEELAWLSD